MNPFKSTWPIENRSEWIGDQKIFDELDSCISQKVNAFVVGVEGSGKTSLLKCFFTFEYKKKMALQNRILIYNADLSTRKDGEDVCIYLADQLRNAVGRLLRESAELDKIMDDLDGIKSNSGETRLQQMIEALHEYYHYFVVLIMDRFEMFTSSSSITIEHHEKLRSLIESRMLQCIVATNYDLSKDSLPADVKGSYLMQKFTTRLLVSPFSEEDTKSFIDQKQRDSDIKLDEQAILTLFGLSGGIPLILETAAEYFYDDMESHDGVMEEKRAIKAAYEACVPIMAGWCKCFTPAQVEVLKLIVSQDGAEQGLVSRDFAGEQSDLRNAVAALKARGILRQIVYTDNFGNVRKGGDYNVSVNSLLFQHFCREGRMEKAVEQNSLSLSATAEEAPVTQVINNYNFYEGSKANMPGSQDHSQTIHADQVQINQGISPSQLISLLGSYGDSRQMFAEQLFRQLSQNFTQGSLPMVADVEVDEDQDLIDVTPAELQTLDNRFKEARIRCRTNLTDQMLELQSERCQFYIKLSVIVEDALNVPGFTMDDYSPQLVLYGKALEQALRDNLFELFHREPVLSVYDTYAHMDNSASSDVFKNKTAGETYIGNYAFLIAEKAAHLGTLCSSNNICLEGGGLPPSWSNWWDQLQRDIHGARRIRNLADHADEVSPDGTKLDAMCNLLFGDENNSGIFERTVVGRRLLTELIPPAIPMDIVHQLVGNECRMRCTRLKQNGGIRGVTCEGGYAVNVSPRKVQKYRDTISEQDFLPEGVIYRVKILEFKTQNGSEFFSAEMIGVDVS